MILFRTRDMLLVVVMLGLAAFTYKVKYDAQKSHAQIRQFEQKIEAARDSINLLKAEWALMSAPTRMARLARQYADELDLVAIDPGQIVSLADIPQRPPDMIDMLIAENSPQNTLQADLSVDALLTGSIVP